MSSIKIFRFFSCLCVINQISHTYVYIMTLFFIGTFAESAMRQEDKIWGFTTVTMKIAAFWDMKPCLLVSASLTTRCGISEVEVLTRRNILILLLSSLQNFWFFVLSFSNDLCNFCRVLTFGLSYVYTESYYRKISPNCRAAERVVLWYYRYSDAFVLYLLILPPVLIRV